MARKVLRVTIPFDGRDKGKSFVITEMSASRAERWAARAIAALLSSGVEVPPDIADRGAAAVAAFGLGIFTRMDFDAAQPLLDEMMDCVEVEPSAGITRRLIEDDIEELLTRAYLRKEVFQLILGFSIPDAILTSLQAMVSEVRNTFNTPTSVMQ